MAMDLSQLRDALPSSSPLPQDGIIKEKEVVVKEETCPAPLDSAPNPTVDSPAAPKKMVVLRSSDGIEFAVEESLAMGSDHIKNMIELGCTDTAVSLPNVTGDMLAKVVEYWRRHARGDEGSEELKQWDKEFADMDDRDERFDLILAANYLSAKPLLELLCEAVADTIEDFTVEEVREYFDIVNDFTLEEEAKLGEEHKWAFEER